MRVTPYLINGPWRGRLAILPRPRGGDWLEDEVKAWRNAGIEIVVSALEQEEVAELDLAAEASLSRAESLEFINYPIADRGVPSSTRETIALAQLLDNKLTEGKIVAIHCRQGVGRSALLAASILVVGGLEVDDAFDRIRTARGCPVPDTPEQREWVAHFARNLTVRLARQ
jgi:protein-tyrosine phosphatase